MKFLIWSTVVCFVSFTLSGIFYGYADFTGLTQDFQSEKYNFQYSSDRSNKEYGEKIESFDANQIEKIKVNSSISEVTLRSGNIKKIRIKVKFLNEDVEKTYKSELINGVLKIETGVDAENQSFSTFFGNNKNGCKIQVTVPMDLVLDYDFKLALGALDIEELKIGNFRAKLAAGNIEVEDVDFKSVVIKAAAGNIELESVRVAETMEINAAAGNVEVKLSQAAPHLEINAAAGNVEISFTSGVKPDLVLNSLSTVGELLVRKDFKKQEGDTYIFGEGKGKVEIKSTFGSVKFK